MQTSHKAGKQVDRRAVLQTAGGAVVVGALSPQVVAQLQSENWKPEVFSPAQLRAVQRFVDAVIPRTDTPGALDAQVDRYIDFALSVESEAARASFVDGLDWLSKHGKKRFGKKVTRLAASEVDALLDEVSDAHERSKDIDQGQKFFRDLKQRTITGFYTSREGWVDELGLPDGPFTTRFRGCSHEDGQHV